MKSMKGNTRTRKATPLLFVLATTLIALSASQVAFASSPVTPNCLGKDISSFARIYPRFFGDVARALSSGGFDDEILAHKQGIPSISSCPDFGFPTPLH